MSFWAGVILENQIVLLIDRCNVEEVKFFKFRRIFHRKYFEVNGKTFFLPGGNLFLAKEVSRILKNRFGNASISIFQLLEFQKEFRKVALSIWDRVKGTYEESLKRMGAGIPNFDSLLAGISPNGRPYLMNFNDANDFKFNILEHPGASFVSPCGPMEEKVKRKIHQFLNLSMGKNEGDQRKIAIELLKSLIPELSVHNRYISPVHDMIFMGRERTDFYHVGVFKSFPLNVWAKYYSLQEERRK